MTRTWYLIDGYNLLHACGMARERYGMGELAKCRERLLNHIARRFTDDERSRTTVVFDGRDPRVDFDRTYVHRGLRVEFAPSNSDADEIIEKLVAQHASPRQLVVVSSDRRLKTAIARRKGIARRSEDFAAELDRRPEILDADVPLDPPNTPSNPDDGAKPGIEVTAEEIAHWEQVFAEAQREIEADRAKTPLRPSKRKKK